MDNQDLIQQMFEELKLTGKKEQEELSAKLNRQHYGFAHKAIPYVIQNHFDDLISNVINNLAQAWTLQLWNDCADESMDNYNMVVCPACKFIKLSDNLGLIYFVMPAPRVSTEAVYTAIIFLIDDDPPSDWLRFYFTLELGTPMRWVLGEWDCLELTHSNQGDFKLEPTLDNFLSVAIDVTRSRWS